MLPYESAQSCRSLGPRVFKGFTESLKSTLCFRDAYRDFEVPAMGFNLERGSSLPMLGTNLSDASTQFIAHKSEGLALVELLIIGHPRQLNGESNCAPTSIQL